MISIVTVVVTVGTVKALPRESVPVSVPDRMYSWVPDRARSTIVPIVVPAVSDAV